MVSSIANISTMLNSNADLLKGSNREAYQAESNISDQQTVEYNDEVYDQEAAGQIDAFANELSQYIDDENLSLEFSKDQDTEEMVMKLVNGETKEVVKQFPPEISLKIARILSKQNSGNITNVKV